MSENSSVKYYQENKERLQKKIVEDVKVFLKNKKKKQQYGCEQYKNLSEGKKQELVGYWKNIMK